MATQHTTVQSAWVHCRIDASEPDYSSVVILSNRCAPFFMTFMLAPRQLPPPAQLVKIWRKKVKCIADRSNNSTACRALDSLRTGSSYSLVQIQL